MKCRRRGPPSTRCEAILRAATGEPGGFSAVLRHRYHPLPSRPAAPRPTTPTIARSSRGPLPPLLPNRSRHRRLNRQPPTAQEHTPGVPPCVTPEKDSRLLIAHS
jgi:hypothetical protein